MIPSSSESVFIGHPVDSEEDSFWGRVRVASSGCRTEIFWSGTYIFLDTTLLDVDSISALKTTLQANISLIRSC